LKLVKSAVRVLEVFELFDKLKRPLGTAEIARSLQFPLSSTSMLLRSLTEMGFLSCDPSNRLYFPTLRISLLGEAIADLIPTTQRLRDLMRRVHQETCEITILGTRNGLNLQYIDIMQDERGRRLTHRSGSLRPLFHAAGGVAILSTYSDDVIGQLVRHYNARQERNTKLVSLKNVLELIAKTRERGYSTVVNQLKVGHGSIAMVLPADPTHHRPLVISVSAPIVRLSKKQDVIVASLRKALAESTTI
jgi:DNA-binding IclR family transcriptional regulator